MLFRPVISQLAAIDCILSLAAVANRPGYVCPIVSDDSSAEHKLRIVGARHPMVEAIQNDNFVPNDISLAASDERFMVITGPNMGGKSSYMRQMALIVIMTQIGSYVPADSAEVGIFDAVYTRMGAKDSIGQGMSTFMVELGETSHILSHATSKSLIIMDELGRGTSTHDGVAIASATMDYIINKV